LPSHITHACHLDFFDERNTPLKSTTPVSEEGTSFSRFPEDPFSFPRREKTFHWSVPWADLMMTLFILFAVLYAFQYTQREVTRVKFETQRIPAVAGVLPEKQAELSAIYELGKEVLVKKDLSHFASVEMNPGRSVRISLAGDLLFDTGKADLKPEIKSALGEIAGVLDKAPFRINLIGHTDDRPIRSERFPSNWELSTSRACSVARFLTEEKNLPPGKFFITGHAEHQPVKPHDTGLDRAANRRVEIIITNQKVVE
jgi:chemotaxis protein MotB